jgi:putative DNA primase/helicase
MTALKRRFTEIQHAAIDSELTLCEVMDLDIPRPKHIFGTWLALGQKAMLYAYTGVGKTWLSLYIALYASNGLSFLGFQNKDKYRTLYVDGEMDLSAVNHRINLIAAGEGINTDTSNLSFRLSQHSKAGLPNMADPAAHAWWLEITKDFDLVVFDNLLSLSRKIKSYQAEDEVWTNCRLMLDALRRRNQAVLLVHHAGKSMQQMGTSQRENAMDAIVQLKKSTVHKRSAYGPASFIEWHFDKLRHGKPDEHQPLYLAMREVATYDDMPTGCKLAFEPLEEVHKQVVQSEMGKGIKPAMLAQKLNLPEWKINELFMLPQNEPEETKDDELF